MRKEQLEQVNESAGNRPISEFPPEVAAILEKDATLNTEHSIKDAWLVLKAEAERHGYGAQLVLPFDMENLEVEYTDQRGIKTRIFSVLYDGGTVHTTQDGLMLFTPDEDTPWTSKPVEGISSNMKDQAALLRSSIQWHKRNMEPGVEGEGPQLNPEGP
ncbi:hypothetical protein [Pseudomonas sp. GXZC]|uniref:hypothetical protein n=1 Tax=Pseudomonas sp. GXZC TaxID=3003351 RepID=UPI0022AA7B0B|nr:hypothetical protein [Pseudomonas sp. GXZC]WAT32235.1 hypothetical protein OZ428_33705 [Pseudomonas sp. GXZC]